MITEEKFRRLADEITGDLYTDITQRILYATDASAYREVPLAVTRPAGSDDIRKIIAFARKEGTSVIPRGAGTSLAGQVVGPGIVMDISKHLNRILEFNPEEHWVKVEPGVVLAELNRYVAPRRLQFGPETSTANRCCMGGMLGNNSCGAHSIIHGSVRDHILEVDAILSDGSEVHFGTLTTEEFSAKCDGDPGLLETRIYRNLRDILSDQRNAEEIEREFPHPELRRRNNGYALDVLLRTDPFSDNGEKINVCRLLAGSEGTLAFTTAMKLNLVPLTEQKTGLVCAHFSSLQDAVRANVIVLKHYPAAVELIDDYIVNCTGDNIEQSKNRFFIKGDPKAILLIEIIRPTFQEIEKTAAEMKRDMIAAGYGYHFPLYTGAEEMAGVWELRRAGLGVLLNIPGRKKSVQVIEDTAVLPELFPGYLEDVTAVLEKYGLSCAYYAHIATGELHLSPLLDLKDPADIEIFHGLAQDIAILVKKYRGSLSGEHGDGRLRGEFIPLMLGEHNYELLKAIKKTWDPTSVFNPGKITDTPPITDNLRYPAGVRIKVPGIVFDFPEEEGLLYATEKCSGSADCRKSALVGGTMCPTFMATGDEDKSTRARANILREFLARSEKTDRFDHEEIYRVMDLCLSCKACKAECPSNVDVAKLKAEFMQHYYDIHHVPFRAWLIAWLPRLYVPGMMVRPLTNLVTSTALFKRIIGFSVKRPIPSLSPVTLRRWGKRHDRTNGQVNGSKGTVCLFADEFTNYNESDIGIKAVMLLERLGYSVIIPRHRESGRTFLSKGLIRSARKLAVKNLLMLKDVVSDDRPFIGIEPSALLTFRDEYPDMAGEALAEDARNIARNALLFDEFISRETERGNITPDQFTDKALNILLHGHCQQKAVASTAPTIRMLSLPRNYTVEEINDGCCGMAGAFGYEKEHYDLSMNIGEMVLFPAVRAAEADTVIAAPGTSCRHHIADGTGRRALHPVEIMYEALKKQA
ncbi:MAG: FAD-linked oxidase C-terminal domain-containing protein [Bacteroidales bacterium]|nr:FAD-linked oxidase C-terminal domain-containing protein [Bacteroidales bacterium]MDT8374182.1 FAD-linked oxidase C-terminal domain-containing protein [Bacteroidales bacterium]